MTFEAKHTTELVPAHPDFTTALAPANIVPVAGNIGRGVINGAYAALMALTSDAVLVFDSTGRIIACNAQVVQLCGYTQEQLLDLPISDLLFDANRKDSHAEKISDLPFATDGSLSVISMHLASGGAERVAVRADKVSAPGETYMLTAKPFYVPSELEKEHDRLVDELALANRRLSGTLKIVLETIDVADVESLFDEVINQITETLDAHGAVLYLAEANGYGFHGATDSLKSRRLPRFMSYREGLPLIIAREGSAMRLRLSAPSEKNLREGALTYRELIDEETSKTYRIPARQAPPFLSLICVPICFDGHVIAFIEVGWNEARPIRKDDARLLDSVAQYLSVEFAAAISTMRAEYTQHLDSLAVKLHERFEDEDLLNKGDLSPVAAMLAQDMNLSIAPIRAAQHGEKSIIHIPDLSDVLIDDQSLYGVVDGSHVEDDINNNPVSNQGIVFPFDLDTLVRNKKDQDIAVVAISSNKELEAWVNEHIPGVTGVIFDLGTIAGERRGALLVRPQDLEPLNDTDLDFLRRVAIDIHETAQERVERSKDTHISQALQNGMRNELQHVEGITAQGLYSSATAAALVGGDFYDLIALPNRRACVILGDVSGKGVEAASVSAAVKTALGAYAWEGQTPARMVRLLNDFLLGFSRLETFATLFVGMIDLAHGRLTYCSAGHPPAIFLQSATHEIQTLNEQSGVVGAFKGMTYHDGHVTFEQGDGLLLYTDGVTEARSPSGAFFGEDGLHDAVMAHSGAIKDLPQYILETLDTFTGRSLEDDVAMVSLQFDSIGTTQRKSSK